MSMFYIVFLVILGQTPATETHAGFPQMTILSKYPSTESCQKARKALTLDDKEMESVICVKILKSDAVVIEA